MIEATEGVDFSSTAALGLLATLLLVIVNLPRNLLVFLSEELDLTLVAVGLVMIALWVQPIAGIVGVVVGTLAYRKRVTEKEPS